MSRLKGSVAIVTGGGQGVGRGISRALAREGAAVAVVGRTLEKCAHTLAEIEANGGRGVALSCDVSNRDQVEATVDAAVAALGPINILVNNAHRSRPLTPIVDVTDKDMAIAMKGTTGALLFMQACYPHLKAAGRAGRVINLGSVSGMRGDAGFASYAMAKEAIRALTRVAAREWGPLGITANVICPFSDSPGYEWMQEADPAFAQSLIDDTALGRIGSSAEEVGSTVAFLASAEGGYITGQTINVDGGMWMVP
jgi:NAD(P)-dependent dehydrogenase (short-subunit alcohol dehydrogenase family)